MGSRSTDSACDSGFLAPVSIRLSPCLRVTLITVLTHPDTGTERHSPLMSPGSASHIVRVKGHSGILFWGQRSQWDPLPSFLKLIFAAILVLNFLFVCFFSILCTLTHCRLVGVVYDAELAADENIAGAYPVWLLN